jgi:septal ring factor EnvC (AmiA/AmiB activator)
MFNTIIIVVLALLALAVAVVTIGWLLRLSKHISELGRRVLESQDIGRIKEAANKIGSFESRMAGCEHKADESQNQLAEHKTKLSELADKLGASEQKMASFEVRFDELAAKLGSVEQMANKNEASLAESIPSIKALADEIQTLQKYQTATEKARSLVLAAFTDMGASIPHAHEEDLVTTPEIPKQEETSQGPEEWQEEAEGQKTSGSLRWQS